MTREEILAMVPGRELDALVAEKVMEWKECSVEGVRSKIAYGKPSYFEDREPRVRIEEYSTDISAAWEVVDGIDGKYAFEIGRPGDYFAPDDKWKARFGMSGWVEVETAPEAICKAALLAVMET